MLEFILILAACVFAPLLLFSLIVAYLFLCEVLWAAGRGALKVLFAPV